MAHGSDRPLTGLVAQLAPVSADLRAALFGGAVCAAKP